MDCIFCKIIGREIPSPLIYENEDVVAFNDIHPKAKTHVLIVPRKHIDMIKNLEDADGELAGKMILAARDIAKEKNLSGYRLQFNVDKSGGQEVFHIHLHLMSNG